MLTNCFRFAPRDSVPGLISKICKYLKEHPGWSVEELKEFIEDIETRLALGEISYFTNQSINDLDTLALYDTGCRFVFIGGGDVYSAMYALEESDGGVIANGVSLGVTESEFNQLKSIVLALKANALTMELLWENGTPSSSFGAQVIPEDQLSLEGWDKIIIIFDSVAGREVYCSALMDLKVSSCEAFTIDKNGKFLSRKVLKAGNKLQFVQAYKYSSYGEYVSDDSVVIPCYIYGIKGVLE